MSFFFLPPFFGLQLSIPLSSNCYFLLLLMILQEPASPSVLALTSKKGLKKSSTKLFNESRAFKGVLSAAKQETSVQTRKGNVVAPRSKNDVEDSDDRKRLRKNSLHASIHCSSKTVESSSKFSPVIQKIRNSTVYAALLNGSKNNSTTLQRGMDVYTFLLFLPFKFHALVLFSIVKKIFVLYRSFNYQTYFRELLMWDERDFRQK